MFKQVENGTTGHSHLMHISSVGFDFVSPEILFLLLFADKSYYGNIHKHAENYTTDIKICQYFCMIVCMYV